MINLICIAFKMGIWGSEAGAAENPGGSPPPFPRVLLGGFQGFLEGPRRPPA
jgi:hypothetical protein